MYRFRNFLVGFLLIPVLFFSATSAHAALTNEQINAVLNLLRSFNVENQTVVNVEAILRQSAECPSITVSLYRGSRDETTGGQVSELQRYLGVEPVSGYFGPITEAAVQKFQRENGVVSSGTPESTGYGVVGPKTRAKILQVCEAAKQVTTTGTSQTQTPSQTTNTTPTNTTPASTAAFNPDSQEFRDLVYQEGVNAGLSAAELVQVSEILSDVATNDAITVEEAEAQASSGGGSNPAAALIQPLVQAALSKAISSVVGPSCNWPGTDFGTPRVISIDDATCSCTGTVLVHMQPVGPSNVSTLSYFRGSQICEAFNIPIVGQKLLGTFIQPAMCWQFTGNGCRKVEGVQGHISPGTGSSLQ